MKKIYFATLLFILIGFSATSQTGNGAIKVTMVDNTSKEPIPFANIVAYRDGVQVGVATTNIEGEAFIKPLGPGKYSVKGVYVGYQAKEVTNITVGEGTAYVTLGLSNGEGVKLDEVEVIVYQVPLIDPNVTTGNTINREDYQNLAVKGITDALATSGSVYQSDNGGGLNVRGGRGGATTYFVDGVKVFGTPNLPQQSIEQLSILTGGVPANFGDLTSGAVSISTRGPQSKFFGGVELISSQITDPYGYNSLGFSVGGPIYKKKDSTQRTVLGFFVSGQGNYIKEPNPSAVPIYRIKDDKLQELKDRPLLPSRSGVGFVSASDFITKDDFNTYKTNANSAARSIDLNGKIDYAPTDKTNISLGGFYSYGDALAGGIGFQLLNANNNVKAISQTFRTNLAITQKFGSSTSSKEKTQSLVTNAFFKFLISYEQVGSRIESARHKRDFFKYGHIGKFEQRILDEKFGGLYRYDPNYLNPVTQLTANSYTYVGRSLDDVVFTPSTNNPDQSLYTSYLISQAPIGEELTLDYIAGNGGLRNGDNPQTVYGLFSNFGTVNPSYRNQLNSTFRIVSSFNADIKNNHSLQFGLEFDQQAVNFYFLNASALWTRARQLVNSHTTQLDLSKPYLNEDFSGLVPYYYFDYLYEQSKQTQFSEKLLDKLGLPRDYKGYINTDALDPSTFDLSMFGAEDLLGGTSITNYIGYSHDGKKTKGKADVGDFLNSKDASGRNLFPVGSFQPIYASVYVMDKFDFKDFKFNLGLRVDRYDANQQVLKDDYAFHDLALVGDLASLPNLPLGFTDNIPSNISKDAAVYVAQNPAGGKSPLAIKGFREGDTWFNSEGKEISDPSLIQSTSGIPVPLFKDNANYDKKLSVDAFTSYAAAINVMPRVAFSFPISDLANFVAHYDVLTQRPPSSTSNLSPLDYYFIDASGSNPLITNPNQLPQKTIDYEFGYEQILTERKNATLKINAFYKEYRNMINQRSIVGAYPKNYIMFDNIDFSTVKGLIAAFDFRRTGGSRINLNYTLQFADGSGSNANSGANLAQSGQPNLRILQPLDFDQRHTFVLNYDYRFGGKKDYKGPKYTTKKGKVVQFLEYVGFNMSFIVGSGTPYTRWSSPTSINGGGRSTIVGQINGSSKPWNIRANLRIDKNIPLTFGKEGSDNRKTGNLNVYLQVLNVLNRRNVLDVYQFTGEADDDGFLTSVQAQSALAITNSAASFNDLYRIRMNDATNFSTPRQIRIGLLFEF